MNSEKWQDLLQQIQRKVLQIPNTHRPLAVVLKHMRFAKQRFDSAADPIAKVAFMLLPLATMLAYIGSDERHKLAARQRAKELLKKLDSKFSLAIGVSADWGLVTQAFIRLFDTSLLLLLQGDEVPPHDYLWYSRIQGRVIQFVLHK